MALFDSLLASVGDSLATTLGDFGYAFLLWLINWLLYFMPAT